MIKPLKTLQFTWRRLVFISYVLCCICLVGSLSPSFASAPIPSPTQNIFVHDYTRTLTQQDASYISGLGESLWRQTGVQSIVVIVPSTDNYPISDYANQLFRSWGIGDKEKDNGLLMLVALEDKTWRVEVGRGLEGVMPDLLSSDIMTNQAVPAFQNGEYSKGIINAYTSLNQTIATEFGITLNPVPPPTTRPTSRNSFSSIWFIVLIGIDLIFNRGRIIGSLFRLMLLRNMFGGSGSPSNRGGGGGGGFGGGSSSGGGSSGSW